MRYLIALFFPPLAVLTCGRPISLIFNLFFFALAWGFLFAAVGLFSVPFGVVLAIFVAPLGVAFWVLAVLQALFVVSNYASDLKEREWVAAMERPVPPV
jgi:hypothetical protein